MVSAKSLIQYGSENSQKHQIITFKRLYNGPSCDRASAYQHTTRVTKFIKHANKKKDKNLSVNIKCIILLSNSKNQNLCTNKINVDPNGRFGSGGRLDYQSNRALGEAENS